MNWKRLQVLFCLIIGAIAVIRFVTGNVIGGLITGAIAVLLFSWTTGYPLASRVRRVWRLLRWGGGKKRD